MYIFSVVHCQPGSAWLSRSAYNRNVFMNYQGCFITINYCGMMHTNCSINKAVVVMRFYCSLAIYDSCHIPKKIVTTDVCAYQPTCHLLWWHMHLNAPGIVRRIMHSASGRWVHLLLRGMMRNPEINNTRSSQHIGSSSVINQMMAIVTCAENVIKFQHLSLRYASRQTG